MNYADIRPIDVANGPGVRVSLFVSGCPHRCPGCFNPETWDFQYGQGFGEEQVRSIRALKETRHACNILPEMEFYCLDYLRSGDPLLREQRELQLLNSWIGYSMFARNYSPLPLASLSGPWEAESVMGLALRGDYARKLKLSTEYPAYLRQSPRCVCTRVYHPKSINAWPAPGDLTRVRRFLEENALEPAGEPFFISDCTLWEGGEERSYSILYVPIA